MPHDTLGTRLKAYREVTNLTQTEMARHFGVDLRAYQRYEADENTPGAAKITAFVQSEGNVNLHWLLLGNGSMCLEQPVVPVSVLIPAPPEMNIPPSLLADAPSGDLGQRLKLIRRQFGFTQNEMAARMGVSPRIYQAYENEGQEPGFAKLEQLCKTLSTLNPAWLLTGSGQMLLENQRPISEQANPIEGLVEEMELVPRFEAHAEGGTGFGVDNIDATVTDYLAFKRSWIRRKGLKPGQLSLIGVLGSSMEPLLRQGDIILIDQRVQDLRRPAIFVFSQGGEYRVKWIHQRADAYLVVRSENPSYPEEVYPPEDAENFKIVGRVVWVGREL